MWSKDVLAEWRIVGRRWRRAEGLSSWFPFGCANEVAVVVLNVVERKVVKDRRVVGGDGECWRRWFAHFLRGGRRCHDDGRKPKGSEAQQKHSTRACNEVEHEAHTITWGRRNIYLFILFPFTLCATRLLLCPQMFNLLLRQSDILSHHFPTANVF